MPLLVGGAELVLPGEQQLPPRRLAQVIEQLVHRTHLARAGASQGLARHRRKPRAIRFRRGRIGRTILDAVAQLAIGVDVEGLRRPRPLHQHHTTGAQRVAHAKLIPDIGVVEREIGDHQVGDQQLLEHVGADVSGALLLVGAEHLEAGMLERRADQLGVDAIEVDRHTVMPGLDAEGHGDEGVRFHLRSEAVGIGEIVPTPKKSGSRC